MNALFVANLELKESEGIYKKVCAQAQAIGDVLNSCDLVTSEKGKAKFKPHGDDAPYVLDCSILEFVDREVSEEKVSLIYVRHMIPSVKLIKVLKKAKSKGIFIFYEIPTYPYFGEQIKTSRRKHRAVVKIFLDIIFWPCIYKYVDKLIVIKSNTKVKMFSKMVEITNGARTENIQEKSYLQKVPNRISMVAVGTLYPYHGYDRILEGLKKCNEHIGDISIEFNVVGQSDTIRDLEAYSQRLGLSNVHFLGIKTTEELNQLYEFFDIGLGCLALHRRNANIDTTIKIIEYYCRGVPVVTSGISPMDIYMPYCTIHIDDSEEPVDIECIVNQYMELTIEQLNSISKTGKSVFSWKNIMQKLISEELGEKRE